MDRGGLSRVYLVPRGLGTEKARVIAPAEDRLALLSLLVRETPGLVVSDWEIRRKESVPTIVTMRHFRSLFPDDELFFIIGADKLTRLAKWIGAEELFTLCRFLVLPRDGLDAEQLSLPARALGADITVLPMEPLDLSSGQIQAQLAVFEDPPALSAQAAVLIAEKGLYHDPSYEEGTRALLKEKRWQHTLGVRHQAVALAQRHGVSVQRAALAALLHDCAKCLPFERMKELALSGGVTDENILSSPEMLHGPAGAVLAREKFDVTDEEILNAVRYHTMGRAGMGALEMCVFVADATEPGRKDYPGLKRLRKLSFESLPQAVYLSLLETKAYVLSQGKAFNPLSEETIAWLRGSLPPEAVKALEHGF